MKITKTKSGKWTTVVAVGYDAQGKRHMKRFTDANKARLRQTASDYLAAHTTYTESSALSTCLARYIDVRASVLSPATVRSYRQIERGLAARYAALDATPIDRITERDLQTLVASLQEEGKSRKTMQNWLGLIGSVMKWSRVPVPPVKLPPKEHREYEIPTEEEVKRITAAAAGTPMEIPVTLALYSLRRGEIAALTIDDLDGCTIHVHRSAVYADGGELIVKDTPKTSGSDRYITIPERTAELIRHQGYVTQMTPEAISEAWRRLLDKLGMPHYVFHSCRHFFASYCSERGVPEADILASGGWKTDHVMKSVYRQAMRKNRATDAISDLLG